VPRHQFGLEFLHLFGHGSLPVVVLPIHQHQRHRSGTRFDLLELDLITPTPVAGRNTSVGIIAYDQYGAVFTGYNGPECLSFTGAANAPYGRAPSYTNAGTCSGGNVVDFVNGVGTANLTLFDAQSITLSATDVPTSVAGLTTLSVAPGVLQNLAVAPQTSNPVAGTPFATDLTAFDEYGTSIRTTPALNASPSPDRRTH